MASSPFASQALIAAVNRLSFGSSTAAFPLSTAADRRVQLSSSNFKVPLFHPLKSSYSTRISSCIAQAAGKPVIKLPQTRIRAEDSLSGSTRSAVTLLAVTLATVKSLSFGLFGLGLQLKAPLLAAAGPAFFAAMKNVPTGSLNTPLTVVAAGMAKWLDIYSGVLMVRVLLSWFPNIPWDRQPLSAIRDLCDPYLNLFRNIIPPIFNTLDVSPLLAFAVLGTLGSILNSSRQAY